VGAIVDPEIRAKYNFGSGMTTDLKVGSKAGDGIQGRRRRAAG